MRRSGLGRAILSRLGARRLRGRRPAEAPLTAVVEDVRRFSPQEQRDDLTLIVARCREAKG